MRIRTYMAAVKFDRDQPHAFTIETHPEDEEVQRLMLDYKANHEMACVYEGDEDACEALLDAALEVIDSGDPAPATLDLRPTIDEIEGEDEGEPDGDDLTDDEFDDMLDRA